MSKRLVIIDGKSVFYRGYYAMPNLSTSDGTPTGGVYGFTVMALEVVKKLKPDYVCVAWDKSKTNIRARLALYPEYKANRKPAPPDFYEQIPILEQMLQALGWPLYEADDLEADDIMGIFAKQAGEQGVESYLITSDLDVLQLINGHTHIYTLKKGFSNIELFNDASFKEKYGIDARQWVDVKALKGDASDNIPGVAGIGEKTAIELIAKYETLEEVYEHLAELKPAVRTKLEAGKDTAQLSKKLVTLLVDAPLKLDLEKAKLGDGITPEFIAMLRKLEFRTLLRQAEATMSEREIEQVDTPAKDIPAAHEDAFAPKDFAADKPRVIALNQEATELWVSRESKTFVRIALEDVAKVSALLANGPVVGHDLKSILRALLASDVDWPGEVGYDTRIGAFLLDSLQRERELSDVLHVPIDMNDPAKVIPAIWQAYTEQRVQFARLPKLTKLAHEIEFPTIKLLAKVEHRGILLDSSYLRTMSQQFEVTIGEFEQKIYGLAGQKFNINSPQQLGMILFDKLQLPTLGVKKGKTGYSTDVGVLDKLRPLHPIIDLISTYREYTKLKSTYIDALPKLVDKEGRIRTTFNLDVAPTGRLSSVNPNLQNIPTRTEIGQAIRTAFVPAKGNVFVNADYSQFELRLAAVLSDDPKMCEAFKDDQDFHTATAAKLYDIPPEQVTKEQRRKVKAVNFGILYGMSPHGLSVATGMTPSEAADFIKKYFELYSSLRDFIDTTAKDALKNGYAETMFGRRRPTPDLRSSNFVVREAAKRAAINMPAQGTEADLMKMAMLAVETTLDGLGQQILQIHDSILVECPESNADQVAALLKETMENVCRLSIPLKVETHIGKNWGEL